MARAQVQAPLAGAGGQPYRRHEPGAEEPGKYTVMFEQIRQEKKKLVSKNSYKIQPPKGYTFVGLHEPSLTDKCKEYSRQDGLPIHIVSTSKGGKHSTELSQQVGRVGHHFATQVVARALRTLDMEMDGYGRLHKQYELARKAFGNEASRKEQKGRRIGEGITDKRKLKEIQNELNRDATAMLKTLFPKIPDRDIKEIIKQAFPIGKERIGSSAEVTLDRKVHLAVLAHIRHGYTRYDRLLKEVPYQTARSIVEADTLKKIIEWRGENPTDDDGAVEDILREIIVIDDDDDDDDVQSPDSPTGDDAYHFESHLISADQIDNHPSAIGGARDLDYARYAAYGKKAAVRPHGEERPEHYGQRRAREDAIRRSMFREVQQQVRSEVQPANHAQNVVYAPRPLDCQRRILVPISRAPVSSPSFTPRGNEMYHFGGPVARRDLPGSQPHFFNDQPTQVGVRAYESVQHPNGSLSSRVPPTRRQSPDRERGVVHQSIEPHGVPEIIDITSSPPQPAVQNNVEQLQQRNDHRYQNLPEVRYAQPPDNVLGKRARPDALHYEQMSKVRRAADTEHAGPSSRREVVTLFEGGNPPRESHAVDHAVPRIAQPANILPAHAYESKRFHVQYSPVHRPNRSLDSTSQFANEVGRDSRNFVHIHGSAAHQRSHPAHFDNTNDAAHRYEAHAPSAHPQVRYAELRGPVGRAGTPDQSMRLIEYPPSERQRFIVERRPISGPASRYAHPQVEISGSPIEQSRTALAGLRFREQLPERDELGRRIVVLEAPR